MAMVADLEIESLWQTTREGFLSQLIRLLNSRHLNLSTYQFILATIKEISMESHPLAITLAHLKSLTAIHPSHEALLPILAHLDAHLPTLIHQHSTLTHQLAQKTAQNKQISRQLRKTHSKLTRKEEECDTLKNELQRVSAIYSQKVQKLTKSSFSHNATESSQSLPSKRSRKDTLRHTDIQCQILSQQAFHRLSQQNNVLRDKLEQTQKLLMEERLLNRDLSLRLQVLNVADGEETDELKDNSTLDADSLRGDSFEEEGIFTELTVVEEEEEDGSSSEEDESQEDVKESWGSWLWRGSLGWMTRLTGRH